MTVSSQSRSAGPFAGNGVTTSFPFVFKVFTKADIEVTRTITDTGVQNVLVLDSDYSVTLNADQDASPGGSIIYAPGGVPMPAGQTLMAIGSVDYTQQTSISNAGSFLPRVIEDALDRNVIMSQQLFEMTSRSLSVPLGNAATLVLPAADQRAGAVLVFDENGNVTVSASITALLQTATAAANSAAVIQATTMFNLAFLTGE